MSEPLIIKAPMQTVDLKTGEVRGHPLPRGRAIPYTLDAMARGRKYAIHDFAKQRIIIGAKDSERPHSEIGAV